MDTPNANRYRENQTRLDTASVENEFIALSTPSEVVGPGGLDCAVSASVIETGDCSVHSSPNCTAHSTAPDWNVHSNGAIDFMAEINPTRQTYSELRKVYDYLNAELFENKLPHCLITLQRRKGTYGYFAAERFGRDSGERTDEIALNPQLFAERTIEENLSTGLPPWEWRVC